MPNLERFWFPRGSTGAIIGGYLSDPRQVSPLTGLRAYPEARTLPELSGAPCLFLLGDSGLGKTEELRLEAERLKRVLPLGKECLHLELGGFSDGASLRSELDHSDEVGRWLASENNLLHLLLDSYDEGHLFTPNLAKILQDYLRKWPLARLRFRLSSRSTDWPESFDRVCGDLYNAALGKPPQDAKHVLTYYLAPLRREDVRLWATEFVSQGEESDKESRIDAPDSFLQALEEADLTEFAATPFTLDFLLHKFAKDGTFPGNRADLWRDGCLELCRERNDNRKESGHSGKHKATPRLSIAARLMGSLVLSNNRTIWIGQDVPGCGTHDLPYEQLCGGEEPLPSNAGTVQIDEDGVLETLNTSLFTDAGRYRVTWRHRRHAEFLAAFYLAQRGMSLPSLISLLCHQGRKVYTPLREVAGHIATFDAGFFAHLLENEVQVLLESDIAATSNIDRENLATRLLQELSANTLRAHDLFRHCRSLRHPGLAAQLSSVISDPAQSQNVRIGAIFMTEGCTVSAASGMESAIENTLITAAMGENEVGNIRVYAAMALLHRGSERTKAALLPLARGAHGAKENRSLKGLALQAVWPNHLRAEELFNSLDLSPGNSITSYETFLSSRLLPHLQADDFPIALTWVPRITREQNRRGRHNFYFNKLCDAIVIRAIEFMDTPGVPEALATIAIAKAAVYHDMAGSDIVNPDGTTIDNYLEI